MPSELYIALEDLVLEIGLKLHVIGEHTVSRANRGRDISGRRRILESVMCPASEPSRQYMPERGEQAV